MSDEFKCASLVTRVSRADWGENRFRGYRVLADLAGQDGFWSMVSLGVGGPRLTMEEARILDDLSTCIYSGDPRIWPMKIGRLVGAYGRFYPSLCAAILSMENASVGFASVGDTARLLLSIRKEVGEETQDRDAVWQALRCRLDRGDRLKGFGVPYRDRDERLGAISRCVQLRGRSNGAHWQLLETIDEVLMAKKRLPANTAAGMAAVMLDLGFTPRNIDSLSAAIGFTNFFPNAVEGSEQAPEVLRELPHACVRYVGPARRTSPRAKGP